MDIFLDTNVFLSFYHFSSDDLEELKKLAVLAREGQVTLHLPEQVINEFRRNRANKIADAVKRLEQQRLALQFPQICKQYEEYEELRQAQRNYKKYHAQLVVSIEKDACNVSLEADTVIRELFDVAQVIPTLPQLVEKAQLRTSLGNPPGKKGSLGDAVNWESLLETVPDGSNLYFIADDSDYFSPLDSAVLDPYLQQEWSEQKGSEICFRRRLSSFFQDYFGQIDLASELEKDLLIKELASSSNFTETHVVVSKLSRFSDFTQSQLNEIVAAAVSNDQIHWMANDGDIYQFLSSVVRGREDLIDPNNLARILYVLQEIEPYGEIPF